MRAFTSLGAVAIAALAVSSASATIMIPLSVEDMTKESVAVVRAKVLDQQADWDKDHKRIYTHTRIAVLDTIHARASLEKELLIRTLGGEVGEVGMKVAGTPTFASGEEVIVFLRVDPQTASEMQVIGMAQGKMHVRRTAKGPAMVVPSLEGLAFARPGPDGVLRPTEGEAPSIEVSLDSFIARVKAAAVAPTTPVATPNVQVPVTPAVQAH